MAAADIKEKANIMVFGLFKVFHMSFGPCNASQEFLCMMDQRLDGLPSTLAREYSHNASIWSDRGKAMEKLSYSSLFSTLNAHSPNHREISLLRGFTSHLFWGTLCCHPGVHFAIHRQRSPGLLSSWAWSTSTSHSLSANPAPWHSSQQGRFSLLGGPVHLL